MANRTQVDSTCSGIAADALDVQRVATLVGPVALEGNSANKLMIIVDVKDNNAVTAILQVVSYTR